MDTHCLAKREQWKAGLWINGARLLMMMTPLQASLQERERVFSS